MGRRTDSSIEELLRREHYTPEELSRLLGIGLDVIRHAAFTGELRAEIREHDIISVQRQDALTWLDEREDLARGSREPGGLR
jgi:aryl carrier-like protein